MNKIPGKVKKVYGNAKKTTNKAHGKAKEKANKAYEKVTSGRCGKTVKNYGAPFFNVVHFCLNLYLAIGCQFSSRIIFLIFQCFLFVFLFYPNLLDCLANKLEPCFGRCCKKCKKSKANGKKSKAASSLSRKKIIILIGVALALDFIGGIFIGDGYGYIPLFMIMDAIFLSIVLYFHKKKHDNSGNQTDQTQNASDSTQIPPGEAQSGSDSTQNQSDLNQSASGEAQVQSEPAGNDPSSGVNVQDGNPSDPSGESSKETKEEQQKREDETKLESSAEQNLTSGDDAASSKTQVVSDTLNTAANQDDKKESSVPSDSDTGASQALGSGGIVAQGNSQETVEEISPIRSQGSSQGLPGYMTAPIPRAAMSNQYQMPHQGGFIGLNQVPFPVAPVDPSQMHYPVAPVGPNQMTFPVPTDSQHEAGERELSITINNYPKPQGRNNSEL